MFFYRVIEEHVWTVFSCVIPVRAYESALAKFPYKLREPPTLYQLAFIAILDRLCRNYGSLGYEGRIKFVFDEQMNEDTKMLAAWDNIFAGLPEGTQKMVARVPAFESDDEFLPLQAADFVAWWCRKHWKENPDNRSSLGNDHKWPYPWARRQNMPFFELSYLEDDLLEVLWRGANKIWFELGWQASVTTARLSAFWRAQISEVSWLPSEG